MATCPICQGIAKPRAENPSFPFCSARCKTIDLGKWMSEEYRVPVEGDEDGGLLSTSDALSTPDALSTSDAPDTTRDVDDARADEDAEKSGPPPRRPVRH